MPEYSLARIVPTTTDGQEQTPLRKAVRRLKEILFGVPTLPMALLN
jgi:hypothetical protein